MAFNFNWSPLTADADFYSRTQDLLTAALNKSPKPPIIVDDIIVNELNLGSVPPELEILEIGDLAEDRFRGIFKMCYSGDAFLTLKTRVQANPLNTYLFSKPSFTSPQPLAASSGLTIPLQITLSEFKLSAFIIVVFSRQKGLTLVFRNDPLESLKVSSTFDSIPFVRDYLQNEIEKQLRTLMMDELPAIIHRLSLRLWCPEYKAREDQEAAQSAKSESNEEEETPIDPFASPPQDAVDARGNVLDASEISSLSLDGGSEIHSLFSQKNLLRLGALTDSHRTLSLFTPSIRDAVFRAWASPAERGESATISTPSTPSLSRTQSNLGNTGGTTYTFDTASESSHSSRPSLVSFQSARAGLSLGSGNHSRSHVGRKKKTRVVNLRRDKTIDDMSSVSGDSETSEAACASEPAISTQIPEEPEDNIITPPRSPSGKVRFRTGSDEDTPRRLRSLTASRNAEPPLRPAFNLEAKINSEAASPPTGSAARDNTSSTRSSMRPQRPQRPTYTSSTFSPYPAEKVSTPSTPTPYTPHATAETSGSILEQAWVLKMAGEIARRAHDEKSSRASFWANTSQDGREDSPPPAYEPAPQIAR
ncbi:putative mitochondrial distribution and morphology protein 34 [Coleophoma crateriformis]|uniref:Mitochondrial distribution and morphology protein 34 n=1 Tax=Coleophoma crateriformis TaxID=565419 RepID=A0A3D8QUR4_9HELO|nr:putative mitochondrial distribution and morphology protein 34 [Coleophoma crateriformis]